ncbi:MAG: ABC transporter substrate-binding protein [Kiloniellaceae bacterium]
MLQRAKTILVPVAAILALLGATVGQPGSAQAKAVKIAFGDIASVESINFLIALERVKERGVDVDITFFKSEDIAAQAVVGGQADVGVGTPYALLQKVKAPIRMFFQLSALRFYPVVNTDYYKDWKDLDGQEYVVHSRGSGTEAIMNLMAKRKGIKYKSISYIPGSEVRAGAMLKGTIRATIVDAPNRNLLLEKGKGKFKVLPMEGVDASDEALYANTEFLENNQETVDILIEELLTVWRAINKDPNYVTTQRKKYGVLADLPAELEGEIIPYYTESAKSGAFPVNGGGVEAAKTDFEFYSIAGQLKGDPADLKVEDFWYFGPLNKALDKLGRM